MTYADATLPEFEREAASTRRVLERIPADKWNWKAHDKSNTIGWNANHLAEIIGWVEGTLTRNDWNLAPADGEPYQSPALETPEAVLALFDSNVAAAKAAIANVDDASVGETWRLLRGRQVMIELPRAAVIRTFILNHLIHHRAILTVYLRLNDLAVPAVYGPSGDEEG